MNQSIHNLAAMPINAAAFNTSISNKKQQQFLMHHQTNTIQHQQQQPLVNQQRQQTLHLPNLYQPYSSLQAPAGGLHQANLSNSSSSQHSPPTSHFHSQLLHFQTQHQQQQQPSNQQQQQYNMNSSDYSSSTYHIYDQISDLIIIKQQRMERKRQQEQRRKMILFALAAILLVGSLLFLLVQSLLSATSVPANNQSNNQQMPDFLQEVKTARSNYQKIDTYSLPVAGGGVWTPPPMLAPPLGSHNRLPANQQPTIYQPGQFNNHHHHQASQFNRPSPPAFQMVPQPPLPADQQQLPAALPTLIQGINNQQAASSNDNNNNPNVVPSNNRTKVIDSCGEHGTLVTTTQNLLEPATSTTQCKCDYGYSGDQCQLPISFQPSISNLQPNPLNNMKLFNRCQLTGCSGNGQCNMQGKCDCNSGFFGDDCAQSPERQCDDGIDNDRDGLVDCADSECCSDKFCQNSTLCMKSPDPLDILMRKQPPPPTSSFFQRMQFLIEKFSSQIYSHPKDFNDRGRVTYLKQGVTGVRVSVAGQFSLGVTLTRDGGYFDLMVNGGGAVVIEFRREPFATHQKTVRVPWNEIVLIEPVELSLDSGNVELAGSGSSASSPSPLPEPEAPTCTAHNYRLMRPVIVTAPKSSRKSHNNQQKSMAVSRAVILQESGLVQQSILLPASGPVSSSGSNGHDLSSSNSNESVSLVYISNRANEFMSTINIQLLPSFLGADYNQPGKLPDELRLVHLKIVIEGNLFEQVFEPQPNLTFTYAWNRRNVYKQKSYGLSTAIVSVGYEYDDCKHIIWSNKQIKLPGHDLSISDIGQQWNLNIHHRYNYRDSILQRGDGQNFNLKTDKPRVVQPIIGDGYQRQAICNYCDGATSVPEQRLLRPQSLISAPDGSLYIADFNLIRKVEFAPSGTSTGSSSSSSSSSSIQSAPPAPVGVAQVSGGKQQVLGFEGARKTVVRTILELPTTRVPSKYSLALNLADNKLYMSDLDRYQIYAIKEQNNNNRASNLEVANETSQAEEQSLLPVVGNGVKCQLEDRANCGDGQLAKSARLIEPKALAFDLANRMYIADGPNVRMVDADGKIYTILGNYAATRHTKFPCTGEAIPMHKFVPRNPIDLALSPIDDTLHILDDNVVFKVTQDKRVQIVAGKLAHCPQGPQPENRKLRATEVFLQSAQSITFGQNGDLFVSEDDQKQMISRVLLVSPEEDSISLYAGLPIDNAVLKSSQQVALPTVDANYLLDSVAELDNNQEKQRSSNLLPLSQTIKASDYKFNSIAAITVDQQGRLIVADKMQLRIVSIEPDLPKMNAAGEFELQSPDNADELLIFNRFGHHIATREISSGQTQRHSNKYTFQYNVNTSFGQLASVSYQTGNKISIYRDGPHHSVKMIETVFGGQCKLDIGRNGQVQSITTIAPNSTKTNFSYHVDGGLLKQSRDQASGELFDFQYDEFGRAIEIVHSSPRLPAPLECRFNPTQRLSYSLAGRQACSNLIVAE